MNNIAEQIIKSNDAEQSADKDELGLPVDGRKTLDYLVARIFVRNPGIYVDPEDGRLYIGQRKIDESQRMVVEMADYYNDWCKGGRWPMVFNRVKKFAPRLDRSKLYIAEGVLWDFDNNNIITTHKKVRGI